MQRLFCGIFFTFFHFSVNMSLLQKCNFFAFVNSNKPQALTFVYLQVRMKILYNTGFRDMDMSQD